MAFSSILISTNSWGKPASLDRRMLQNAYQLAVNYACLLFSALQLAHFFCWCLPHPQKYAS